ncbi:MAG: hypothetical protein GY747_11130 [Planctomycetes bacterium]|nr:hypothetical protein [Planctomycetota bacterium]MCP4772183.1 hypothetical protein [Planctomycetota bacterium]MCP4861239.1 hypothetical protein [Planctomycetota bacterium]
MLTTLILTLLPAALPQAEVRYAEIAVEKTSIRSFYDKKAATVLEVDKGFPVQVVAELVPWSKVRVPGGFDVWVHQDYVEFEAGRGTITSNRVRIRPLPSTSSQSHALGHFSKGDEVIRLGVEGDWVKVRYKESVGAWIETKDLVFTERELSQWQRLWSDMADLRIAVPLPEEPIVEEGETDSSSEAETDSSEEVASEQASSSDSSSSSAGQSSSSESSSSESSSSRAANAAAKPKAWTPFSAAQVAIKPEENRALADKQLKILADAVTKSNDNWDRDRLDNLEMVYGNVIWHSTDRKQIDLARTSLTKVDGLRRFYLAVLASDARRAEAAGDKVRAVALQDQRAREMKPRLPEGGGTAVEVGWVEYHPKVSAHIPFKVVRGPREIPMHSYDGHQQLRDFVNHEIVVRGTWREDKSVVGERVLAITELRVLPARRK